MAMEPRSVRHADEGPDAPPGITPNGRSACHSPVTPSRVRPVNGMEDNHEHAVSAADRGNADHASDLLDRVRRGDEHAVDALFDLVYGELRSLAHRHRVGWHGNATLNTTALVHEAYLKLEAGTDHDWENRAHFLAVVSKAIRHVLVNYARDRTRQKRGDGKPHLSLERIANRVSGPVESAEDHEVDMLMLDAALTRLESMDRRQSRIVECRFFGDMTIQETAAALGISPASVSRGWSFARTWLYREMTGRTLP